VTVNAPASANDQSYAFQSLHPEFLRTHVGPSYSQHVPSISPAAYDQEDGDYIAEFDSPGGRPVRIVIKSPVTHQDYDVPAIAPGQSVADYLNGAFLADGKPRSGTVIRFPKGTYSFEFPLSSNCDSHFVHWQLPAGASDLVVDGQGSTVNFSDLCLGLNLAGVQRVTFKNFRFAWPHLQIGTVATVTAIGGNGTSGYTYDVRIDPAHAANMPAMLAAATSWDRDENHWDLINIDDDISYGDGVTNGVPLQCTEPPGERKIAGCDVKGIPSYGVQLKVGETLLLRHYSFASAISGTGEDITLDNISVENAIGTAFLFNQGRSFHITRSTLTRMPNQPISGAGNAFMFNIAVSGDVVIEDSSFGYQGDDGFDMNTQIARFTPTPVNNATPMATFQFNASRPSELQWPAFGGPPYGAQQGDTIALFDNTLAFRSIAKVTSATLQADGSTSTLVLDHPAEPDLAKAGFIAADLSIGAGARYLIRNNTFAYNRARALLLQTPFGWVDHNRFIGQTLKSLYVLASQYWGEGPGAHELIVSNNVFDSRRHRSDFLALDLLQEAADFPNSEDEMAGATAAVASVNQNIVVAHNRFSVDKVTANVNVSSAKNVVFSGNDFDLVHDDRDADTYQLPVAVHDAAHIYFDNGNRFDPAWLSIASCAQSRLLGLLTPSPNVTVYTPAACGIVATTSDLVFKPRR
jgi:hypothetical protein